MNAPPLRQTANGQLATLKAHGYTARIATVGATLCRLDWQGRDLVRGFDPDQVRPGFSGALLAPWPNRVVDARYSWDGVPQQLPVTEPERGHALHGLVFNADFEIMHHREDALSLSGLIPVQAGYPSAVRLEVEFRVEPQGVRTELSATNIGQVAAPFGWGSHSYLVAPGQRVDEWTLDLPAQRLQLTSTGRLLPAGMADACDVPELDFRSPRPVGTAKIDHAYTALLARPDGSHRVAVTDAAGDGAQISWDSACGWVQVHTADHADPALDRTGLAIEPMSCPPGAYNSGDDLIRLEPGAVRRTWWRIGPVRGGTRSPF